MTSTEHVRSETILREVRARVLALVKNPPTHEVEMRRWEVELVTLLKAEAIYRQPEIIPISTFTPLCATTGGKQTLIQDNRP